MVPHKFPQRSVPVALAIAGFDPSSGAGITADLKTFAAYGVYGVSCATALTVQSTQGVQRVLPVDAELAAQTLTCLTQDLQFSAVKIGMLATVATTAAVSDFLAEGVVPRQRVVLDPVIRSSSGALLLDSAAIEMLRSRLLPQVGWITPNLDELAILSGVAVIAREDVHDAAGYLQQQAKAAGNPELWIVVTGGHLDRPDDYVLSPDGEGTWIPGVPVQTTSTHGTGCAFSSALACELIGGREANNAVAGAKRYVAAALSEAYPVGKGRGPMHHLWQFKNPRPT